jgi:Transposase DDE domain
MPYRFTSEEDGKRIRRYWTNACQNCSLKSQCTTGPERRIPRWEHEHPLDAVQQRLDANPLAMRQRRETVEHPFGPMKARMGATHFLTKILPKVAAEMALSVLAYNLTRVMNIVGPKPLMAAVAQPETEPILASHRLAWEGRFYTAKTRLGLPRDPPLRNRS